MINITVGTQYKNYRGDNVLIVREHPTANGYYIGIIMRNSTIFCLDINDWVPYTNLSNMRVYNSFGHFGANNKNPEQLIVHTKP